jgi:hypothetical protein
MEQNKDDEVEEFTITLCGSSSRLPKSLLPMFSEFLHPEMQALYKPENFGEDNTMVGIQFSLKSPTQIAQRVGNSGVRVARRKDGNLYLYLPNTLMFHQPYPHRSVFAKVKCRIEDNLVKLYWHPSWKRQFLEDGFR